VEAVAVHPDYEAVKVRLEYQLPGTLAQGAVNDIALITLERDVEFSEVIRPVCLQHPDPARLDSPEKDYVVAGWGATKSSRVSDVLLYTSLAAVPPASCQAEHPTLRPSQLCARGADGMDSCNGDSGGPLVAEVAGRWYLAGVVSFGAKACDSSRPGVYSRVASYYSWLGSTIGPTTAATCTTLPTRDAEGLPCVFPFRSLQLDPPSINKALTAMKRFL
jgi:secreted trypsin-like serine protease